MKLFKGLFFVIVVSCTNVKNPIENALESSDPKIKRVVQNMEAHELQVIFTEVNQVGDSTVLIDHSYNVNKENYFYPASTVKFPIAVLALEKINELSNIDRNTIFKVEKDSVETTISKEIEKIFAVSDNEAYNRLYDFLGRDNINESLRKKGISARISHKLSTQDYSDYPLYFFKKDSLIFSTNNITETEPEVLKINRLLKGKGYIKEDSLVLEPMDFSKKNYLPLESLHSIIKRVIFPELFAPEQRFNLASSDYDFLLNAMKLLPKQAGYTSDEYYDSYVKFLIFGDNKSEMPEHIEIYNKVGYAYGYLTDCAYILDKSTGKSYFISATVHVNENKIYNDGVYEYEDVGIPFLAELGRQLTNLK